jgi:hypothetical protein
MAAKMTVPPANMVGAQDPGKPPPGNARKKKKLKKNLGDLAQKLYGKKG